MTSARDFRTRYRSGVAAIRDVRLARLRLLLREEKEKRTALAARIKKSPAQISQWLSGYRTITEETAREIERNAGKPKGWLDALDAALAAQQSPARASLVGDTLPPAPGPRFADRREVSESDWGTLQDVLLVLEPAELERIRAKAERMRRVAAEQLDGLKGKP